MIERILQERLSSSPKSILLLGPRQVGKSTLCRGLKPDLIINFADQLTYTQHIKDVGLLRRILAATPGMRLVMIDEVQRIPSILNTIQAVTDENKNLKFLLTGSSARKLKRGNANLLPGRVFNEFLPPLTYWELETQFDLDRALTIGTLPEVYLEKYGPTLLESYVTGYLREEIQAEALTKDLGAYSRFLDLAAELSGHYLNYSKIASESEIRKETIRRYMQILEDTLLLIRVPSYTKVEKRRRARQKDRFIFFDLGVRNQLCGRHQSHFSSEEFGQLFEQWIILQAIYFSRLHHKNWKISTYRDETGIEIDLIIETPRRLFAVEIKWSESLRGKMGKNLNRFENEIRNSAEKILVYRGEFPQDLAGIKVLPYRHFLTLLTTLEE